LCEKTEKPLLIAGQDDSAKMDPDQTDSELIYAKTTSGEEAMLQRTRVVQRNLRMVLILVDGNATVAELCDKTGNQQLTLSALLELENDGFIERRVEEDSVWTRGRRLAQQIKARAAQPLSEFSTFGKRTEPPPPRHSLPDAEVTRLIPAPEESPKRFSLAATSSPPLASSLPPRNSVPGPESRTVFFNKEEEVSAAPTAPPENAAEQAAPSFVARVKALLGGGTDDAREGEGPDLKSLQGRRLPMTWPMAAMLGSALLSALLVLTAFFFPYSRYLPTVESALAETTGQKISIEEMRVTIYPRPGLLLANVRVGNAAGEELMQIAELRLRPELGTLFSPRIVFAEMELRDLDLSATALTGLSRMFAATARESAKFGVQRVTISNANISFAGLGFDDLSGELALSADGLLESVSLKSADRSLQSRGQASRRPADAFRGGARLAAIAEFAVSLRLLQLQGRC
jgi:hypothetical protein